jgi:hypothetical protein
MVKVNFMKLIFKIGKASELTLGVTGEHFEYRPQGGLRPRWEKLF